MVEISLGRDFKGGVHRQQGRAAVDDVHAEVGQIHGDGSASALIDLAQFGVLIEDTAFRKRPSDGCGKFGVGFIGARFATCPR